MTATDTRDADAAAPTKKQGKKQEKKQEKHLRRQGKEGEGKHGVERPERGELLQPHPRA